MYWVRSIYTTHMGVMDVGALKLLKVENVPYLRKFRFHAFNTFMFTKWEQSYFEDGNLWLIIKCSPQFIYISHPQLPAIMHAHYQHQYQMFTKNCQTSYNACTLSISVANIHKKTFHSSYNACQFSLPTTLAPILHNYVAQFSRQHKSIFTYPLRPTCTLTKQYNLYTIISFRI
jgi:hypothetical protein